MIYDLPVSFYFLNGYFIFVTLSLLAKEILWLRVFMIFAGISVVIYGIIADNSVVAIWNSGFLLINIIQVIRILNERKPITLPPFLEEIYLANFNTLRRKEFLNFWNIGQIHNKNNIKICEEGKIQKEIHLILKGEVSVIKNGNEITKLSKNSFVGEISFLTGKPANADVIANGEIEYISWSQDKLRNFKLANKDLYIKLQTVLGHNLSEKLN